MNVKNTVPGFRDYYNNISMNKMDEMANKNYDNSLKAYDTPAARGIYGLDDNGDIAISEGMKEILWNQSVQKMFDQIKDNWVQHETGIDPTGLFRNLTGIGNGYWLIYRAKAVTSNSEAKAVIAETAVLSGISYLGGNYNFKGLVSREGFLFGGAEMKAPFNIPVQRAGRIGANEVQPWGLPIGKSKFANRTFNAILPEWNTLTDFTRGTIPKGTPIKWGIIGPQGLKYPGGSLQFNVNSMKVIKQ